MGGAQGREPDHGERYMKGSEGWSQMGNLGSPRI